MWYNVDKSKRRWRAVRGIFSALLLCGLLSACSVAEELPLSEPEKLVMEDVVLGETGSSFYANPQLSLEEALFLVEQDIQACFFQQHDPVFLAEIGRSLEDSQWMQQSTVWMETGNLLSKIWSEYPDEDTHALAKEVLSQMFQKMAYRVDSAEFEEETGDILVKILVAPMGAVGFATEEFLQDYFYQVIEGADVLTMSLEDYIHYDNLACQGLLVKILDNTREMSYGKEQELTLRLISREDGFQVDTEDWYQLRGLAVDYVGY